MEVGMSVRSVGRSGPARAIRTRHRHPRSLLRLSGLQRALASRPMALKRP